MPLFLKIFYGLTIFLQSADWIYHDHWIELLEWQFWKSSNFFHLVIQSSNHLPFPFSSLSCWILCMLLQVWCLPSSACHIARKIYLPNLLCSVSPFIQFPSLHFIMFVKEFWVSFPQEGMTDLSAWWWKDKGVFPYWDLEPMQYISLSWGQGWVLAVASQNLTCASCPHVANSRAHSSDWIHLVQSLFYSCYLYSFSQHSAVSAAVPERQAEIWTPYKIISFYTWKIQVYLCLNIQEVFEKVSENNVIQYWYPRY